MRDNPGPDVAPTGPKVAAQKLEVPKGQLVFADEHVFDASDPEKRLTFAEAVVAAEGRFGTIGTVGSYRPPKSAARYKGGGVGPSPSYTNSNRRAN